MGLAWGAFLQRGGWFCRVGTGTAVQSLRAVPQNLGSPQLPEPHHCHKGELSVSMYVQSFLIHSTNVDGME